LILTSKKFTIGQDHFQKGDLAIHETAAWKETRRATLRMEWGTKIRYSLDGTYHWR
jgi:hypothetical protein